MYYDKLDLLIAGEFCQGSEGKSEAVLNPATEEEIARVPHASTALKSGRLHLPFNDNK